MGGIKSLLYNATNGGCKSSHKAEHREKGEIIMKEPKEIKELKKQIKEREQKIKDYKKHIEHIKQWIEQEEFSLKFEKRLLEKYENK